VWGDVCDLLHDPARIEDEHARRLDAGGGSSSLANEKQKLLDAAGKTRRAIARRLDRRADRKTGVRTPNPGRPRPPRTI
jgi:hypothetical protein